MSAAAGREVRYPFITNGAVLVWSIPFRGDEPGDAIEVTYSPQGADTWHGFISGGGWLNRMLQPAELEEALKPYELRDTRGKSFR